MSAACRLCRWLWDRPEHLQALLDAAQGRMKAWVHAQQRQDRDWGQHSLGQLLQDFFAFYAELFSDWVLGKRRCADTASPAALLGRACQNTLLVAAWARLHSPTQGRHRAAYGQLHHQLNLLVGVYIALALFCAGVCMRIFGRVSSARTITGTSSWARTTCSTCR
jgi:hypothetical protein